MEYTQGQNIKANDAGQKKIKEVSSTVENQKTSCLTSEIQKACCALRSKETEFLFCYVYLEYFKTCSNIITLIHPKKF